MFTWLQSLLGFLRDSLKVLIFLRCRLKITRNTKLWNKPKSGALVRTFHWTALVWGWVNIWSTDHLSEHRNIWSSELTSDSEIGWTSKWTSGLLNELMWLGMKIIKVDEKSDSSRATMGEISPDLYRFVQCDIKKCAFDSLKLEQNPQNCD